MPTTPEWINKQVHPYNGELLSSKKAWTTWMSKTIRDPQKHHAIGKKSDIDTRNDVSSDSIYLKFYKRHIYTERKISHCLGLRWG